MRVESRKRLIAIVGADPCVRPCGRLRAGASLAFTIKLISYIVVTALAAVKIKSQKFCDLIGRPRGDSPVRGNGRDCVKSKDKV